MSINILNTIKLIHTCYAYIIEQKINLPSKTCIPYAIFNFKISNILIFIYILQITLQYQSYKINILLES